MLCSLSVVVIFNHLRGCADESITHTTLVIGVMLILFYELLNLSLHRHKLLRSNGEYVFLQLLLLLKLLLSQKLYLLYFVLLVYDGCTL